MANRPDHANSFIQQGHGWMAAVSRAPLGQLERLVWLEVEYQWLGWARREVVILSPAEIGRRAEQSRGNVGTAIRGLEAKRMLRRVPGVVNGYDPEGDHRAWLFDEKPEARAARLAYIAAAVDHARSIKRLDLAPPPPPARPPAGKQLSFLDQAPAPPPDPPAPPERTVIPVPSVLPIQYDPYCDTSTERTANPVPSVLPIQYESPRAIEERPRGIEIKKDLKIFLDAEAGGADDAEPPGKKTPIYFSGDESPEELVALFNRHRDEQR